MASSQDPAVIDLDKFLKDTDPPSNPDTAPTNKKINATNVQGQFKKLGPPPPLPPIPKEPSTDQSVASSVARKRVCRKLRLIGFALL